MRISQFQKYSQKENTVTNNVLLMLSRLNDIKPEFYKELIQKINDNSADDSDENYSPSPIFQQQVGKGEGIIDGRIEIKASKIIIETKNSGKEDIRKLLKYCKRFEERSLNYLWHISTEKYNDNEREKIRDELDKLEKSHKELKIIFNSITFLDLVEKLKEIYESNKYNEELKLLFEDFDNYCNEENLIPDYQYKLIFVPTSFSYNWNFKYKIYLCPINRQYRQKFAYFGLYHNKSVRTIATVENCIVADFEQGKLTVHYSTMDREITEKQKEKITNGFNNATEFGDVSYRLKYYLFDENDFFETNFYKSSKGGIQGFRYKDLRNYLGDEQIENKNTKEIANFLNGKAWD